MNRAHDAAGLLGGAMLALGCVPLLARGAATAGRAATAPAVLLALVLAGRGLADAAGGELAGAAALAALGLSVLPRLLRTTPASAQARASAQAGASEQTSGRWRRAAAGLGLVVLGAAAARGAALLQGAAIRDTLGLALPAMLLGLLAVSLRREAAVRVAAMASALHGVVLAALALPDGGAGPAVFVGAPAVAALLALTFAGGQAGAAGRTGLAGPEPAADSRDPGPERTGDWIGHEA